MPDCHDAMRMLATFLEMLYFAKEFLRQGVPSTSVFSTEGVVSDVLGVEGGSCLGSGSMEACKDAGEERGNMIGWAIIVALSLLIFWRHRRIRLKDGKAKIKRPN